jgi:hypothetical protein
MVLVSLCGVIDLFSIMPDYPDGVWLREMMQLMLSNDTDSDNGAHEISCVVIMMLPVKWFVYAQDHCL